jgi:hypothetical protein
MGTTVKFQGSAYMLQITDHAQTRMTERGVSDSLLLSIIETGQVKPKPQMSAAFWVFVDVKERNDNSICVSLIVESGNLVIKTVLINWRPQ